MRCAWPIIALISTIVNSLASSLRSIVTRPCRSDRCPDLMTPINWTLARLHTVSWYRFRIVHSARSLARRWPLCAPYMFSPPACIQTQSFLLAGFQKSQAPVSALAHSSSRVHCSSLLLDGLWRYRVQVLSSGWFLTSSLWWSINHFLERTRQLIGWQSNTRGIIKHIKRWVRGLSPL